MTPSLKSQVEKCRRNLKALGLYRCVAVLNVSVGLYLLFYPQSGCINTVKHRTDFYKYYRFHCFFFLFLLNKKIEAENISVQTGCTTF